MFSVSLARHRLPACALGVGLALSTNPASAAFNSFSYPPQAVTAFSGAQAGSGILLPPTGAPAFQLTFVLPRDYQTDGQVSIVLYLSAAFAPCRARIVASELRRKRLGVPEVDSMTGLNGGAPTVGFTNSALVQKVFTLLPGSAPPGQIRGDAFTLQINRLADDPTDTCPGSVFVHAIDIRYPVP